MKAQARVISIYHPSDSYFGCKMNKITRWGKIKIKSLYTFRKSKISEIKIR